MGDIPRPEGSMGDTPGPEGVDLSFFGSIRIGPNRFEKVERRLARA